MNTKLTEDAVRSLVRAEEASDKLAALVRDLLELHIAHHNHPTHAAARALLASLGAN